MPTPTLCVRERASHSWPLTCLSPPPVCVYLLGPELDESFKEFGKNREVMGLCREGESSPPGGVCTQPWGTFLVASAHLSVCHIEDAAEEERRGWTAFGKVWFLGALCNGERTGSSPETWVQPEQQLKVMNIGNLQGVEPRSLQFRPCYRKQPGRKEFSVLKSSSTRI